MFPAQRHLNQLAKSTSNRVPDCDRTTSRYNEDDSARGHRPLPEPNDSNNARRFRSSSKSRQATDPRSDASSSEDRCSQHSAFRGRRVNTSSLVDNHRDRSQSVTAVNREEQQRKKNVHNDVHHSTHVQEVHGSFEHGTHMFTRMCTQKCARGEG